MQLLLLLLLIFTLIPLPTLSGSGGGIVGRLPVRRIGKEPIDTAISHLTVSTASSRRRRRVRTRESKQGKGLKGQQQPPLNPLGYFSLSRI